MKEYFNEIMYLDEVDSTNTYLMNGDYDDKTIAYTFRQSAGRGRLDRNWQTVSGKNIALSICFLNPQINPVWITGAVALGLIETLEEYGVQSSWIKWPNDVHTDNGKIAGILTECRWSSGVNVKTVTGIGININADVSDLAGIDKKTTSVLLETGNIVDIKLFTNKLIESVGKYLKMGTTASISQLKEKWISHSKVIGRAAVLSDVFSGSGKISGKVEYIDDDGYLYFNDGTTIFRVVTGDINIL